MNDIKILLRTTGLLIADTELLPLEQQRTQLEDHEHHLDIQWGTQIVRLGALETSFEVIGLLAVAGGVTVKVASTLLTKWLWSKIEAAQNAAKRQPNQAPPRFEVEVQRPDGVTIKVSTETIESLEHSLVIALDADRSSHG